MERFYNSRTEKQSIYDIFRACRLCGAGGGYKMPIIHDISLSDIVDVEIELKRKIRECVSIEVHTDDKMPPLICELCVDKVNDFYEFREMCRETNERTRARLGLPPQTLGPSESEDCILGFTSPVYPSPNQAPKEPPSETGLRVSQGRGRPRKKPPQAKPWPVTPTAISPTVVKTRRSVEKEKKVDTPPPTPPPTRSSRKEARQLETKHQETRQPETRQGILKNSKASKVRRHIETSHARHQETKQQETRQPETRQPETRQGILKNSKASKLAVTPQPLLKEKGRGKREAEREREPPKPVKKVKLQVSRRETPPPPPSRTEKRRATRTLSPPAPKVRRAHAVSHAPVTETFKCELCGAGYVKKSSLSNHMVSLHSPSATAERLACTPCREWFASAEDAAAHHRWHKATATFYHCHACTADFKQLSGFNKHFMLKQCVPEVEVPDLQCAECWLTFPTTTWMEQHNCGGPDARPGGECYKCRKKFAKYKQLSKHEESCIGKGKKTVSTPKPDAAEPPPAVEETPPRIQPVQIRMQRCDKLLQRIKREPTEHDAYYDVSEVKPEFGLDKSCTYPYISSVGTVRIKTEPENHDSDFITSDNIKQEIKEEVSYGSDYLDTGFGDDYYSDGSEKTNEQPAPKMVINPFAKKQASSVEKLSTISLRTIFSGQFLGKIPLQKRKRKRKIKEQPLDDFSLEVKTEIMAEEEERMAAEANGSSLFDSILENRTEVSRLSSEITTREDVEESGERDEKSIQAKRNEESVDTEKVIDNIDTASRLSVGESADMEETTESGTVEDRIEPLETGLFSQEKEMHETEDDGTKLDKLDNEGKEGETTLERDSDKSDLSGEKSEVGLVENNLEDKDIGEKVSDESDKVFGEEDLVMDKERTEGESTESDGREEKEADNGGINDKQTEGLEDLNEIMVMKNKEESADISEGKVEKEAEMMNLHAYNDTKEEESGRNMEIMEVDDAKAVQEGVDDAKAVQEDVDDAEALQEDMDEAEVLEENVDDSDALQEDRKENDEDVQEEEENVDDSDALQEDRKENDEDVEEEEGANDNKIPVEGNMNVDAAMEELEAVLLMGNEDSKEGQVDELPLKINSESEKGNELSSDESSKDAKVPLFNEESKDDEEHRHLGNSVSEVPEEEMDFDINSVFGGDLGPVALKSTCKISTTKKLVVPEENKSTDLPTVSEDCCVQPSRNAHSAPVLEPITEKSEEAIVSDRKEDKSKPLNDVNTVAEEESQENKSTDEENKAGDLENLQNSNQLESAEEERASKAQEKMDEAKENVSDENNKVENSILTEKVVQSAEEENRTDMDEMSDTEYDENELLKEPEETKDQEDSERNILNAAEKAEKNSEHDILDLISDSGDDCNIVESPDKQTKTRSMPNDEKSEGCDGEKISLDELLLASKEVTRLPEGEAAPKNDKNSLDLDSISDDEFDFDQN